MSILRIMDKDHKKIKEILMDFEKEENRNFEKSKHIFSRFKWMLEKHFFIEEKAIFNYFVTDSQEENENLMKILKEHREILDLIERAEDILIDHKILDIEELKHSILIHARFEDEVFYPRLDELLDEKEKQEMINRVKDILME